MPRMKTLLSASLAAWAMTACAGTSALLAAPVQAAEPPLPAVAVGRIERLVLPPSRHVDARPVDVWLPADYTPARRHAVLYVHDGQMLFDERITWNKQAWHIHLAVDRLMRAGRIPPTLVVGVWNNGERRRSEYYPEKFLPYLAEPVRQRLVAEGLAGQPRADAYLRFVVDELKPAIDARYATHPGRAHTAVLGSSMGGLISVYALSEYPQVFSGAAGLSTHWVGGFQPNAALPLAAFEYLRDHLPAADGQRRLYMDHGTTELDAIYAPYQAFVDEIVRERGYTSRDSASRVFAGTGHNERAWAERVHLAIEFLLGGR
jgi:enterochelin esterase-like enzyme